MGKFLFDIFSMNQEAGLSTEDDGCGWSAGPRKSERLQRKHEKELIMDKCDEGRAVPRAQMESETINHVSVSTDNFQQHF